METLDKDQKVINWSHAGEKIPSANGWTKFSGTVIVPGQVAYIRFRLMGAGTEEFRFDDLSLWKKNRTGNLRNMSHSPTNVKM